MRTYRTAVAWGLALAAPWSGVSAGGGTGTSAEVWALNGAGKSISVILDGPTPVVAATIDLSDPDGDLLPDAEPSDLAFSTVPGTSGLHAFVAQGRLITVVDVVTQQVAGVPFNVATRLGFADLTLRGCATSVPRRFEAPGGAGATVRSYLHVAATLPGGDAAFVVLDQEELISTAPGDPLIDWGILATDALALDVTVPSTPVGGRFQRAWYTASRAGVGGDELLAVLATSPVDPTVGWQISDTRTFPVAAGSLPERLRPDTAIGRELPVIPLGSSGRLQNLYADDAFHCDLGGNLTSVRVSGPGTHSFTVFALDATTNELLVVDATDCTFSSITVGAGPSDVTTVEQIQWRTAWVTNRDADTVSRVSNDGTVATVVLAPPGAACSLCPVAIDVARQTRCDIEDVQVTPVDTDANGMIDTIRLTWDPVGCAQQPTYDVMCHCLKPEDCVCDDCNCGLPDQPEECYCPGLDFGFAAALAPGGGGLQVLAPTNECIAKDAPWEMLGATDMETFDHAVPEGNEGKWNYDVQVQP